MPAAAAALLIVVATGSYRRVERIAIVIGLFELAFFAVAWAAHPNLETLAEDIRSLLELSSSDCEQVGKLAAQQLKLVHAKLRQLRRIESVLAKTVEQCARRKGNQPCPIIDALSQS